MRDNEFAGRSTSNHFDDGTFQSDPQMDMSPALFRFEQNSVMCESSAGKYLKENGWLLFLQKVGQRANRRTRDYFLARELGTTQFHVGRQPKLRGIRHLRVGDRFTAGDELWLEAITGSNGEVFSPLLTIGRNVNFSDYVHVGCINRVAIGNGVLCGSRVIITDHDHGCYAGPVQTDPQESPGSRRLFSDHPVVIGDNVWLGEGVAVLSGADIGAGAIIGANSVVKGIIPPLSIAAGAPARPFRVWEPSLQQWRKL